MRFFKLSVACLCVAMASAGVAWGQADNYKAHKNDTQEHVSQEEMAFYLVFKSHFDIGYSALARDVVHEYRTSMIDKALDVMDANANKLSDNVHFAWTVPGWPLVQMLWDKQSPTRRQRIEKALTDGNLVTHALPFTTHTGTLELEDLARGLGYGSSLARQYNLPLPTDGKMTDVPGHTWILPTIMHHAGIKFFHFGSNPTNQVVKVPLLFWWEGPDGSRVLTMFSQGYGGGLFPPEGWNQKAWLAFIHAGDNAGPPTAEAVEEVIAQIKSKYPKATIHIGKMSDFADAILASNPDLPVVRGDMSDSWVHGVMSNPQATSTARRVRPMIPVYDMLHTENKDWGIVHYSIKEELAHLYEQSLLYGEHTWGLANQHFIPGKVGEKWDIEYRGGLAPNYAHMVNSWKEHVGYIQEVENKLRPEWENELYTLAENVAQDGFRFVVYNPLPWERDGFVTFRLPSQGSISEPSVKDVSTGKVYKLKTYGGDSQRNGSFFAEDIPAGGYKTFVLTREEATGESSLKGDVQSNTIENRWFKITFDPERGSIKSIWDKVNGREWVDQAAKDGFGSYVYERYDKQQSLAYLKEYIFSTYKDSHYRITGKCEYLNDSTPGRHESPRNLKFYVEDHKNNIQGVLIPQGDEQQHTAGIRVTLYEDEPYIDIKLNVINHPATEEPESGWIALPFQMKNPTYRIGRLGSVIDPSKDILEGSQFNYIWSNTGIMLKDGDYSVGICSIDAPAVQLGGLNFMHFAGKYENPQPHLYFNLFNNRWNTNFTSFWSGNLQAEVRLWANAKGADDEEGLITPAWETRLPLQVGIAQCGAGKLPITSEGVKVSRKGVLVTAYGENPDGDGKLIRVWENGGKSGVCDVSLPTKRDGVAQPVNLRGVPEGAPVKIVNGSFSFDLGAFSPASFLIY